MTFICQSRDRSRVFFVITFQIGGEQDIADNLVKRTAQLELVERRKQEKHDREDELGVD